MLQSGTMTQETNEEKSYRLARIRENQRKSRARKQQYIQELEQKVAAWKAEAQQKDIEHRISLQKLELENARLRDLLTRLGMNAGYVEEYLRGDDDRATSEKVAIPALKRPEPSTQTVSTASSSCTNSCSKDAGPVFDMNRARQTADMIKPKQSKTSSNPSAQTNHIPDQSQDATVDSMKISTAITICDCPPDGNDPYPANENALNTTVCAIAEELIHQYNTRGVDISVIKERLCQGFRKGVSAGEGCRVQNHILFEVLDEISGNLS